MSFFKDKTIIISGGSRGVGLEIAKTLGKDGANIAILAKTTEPHPTLPGTIYTAAEEIEAVGGSGFSSNTFRLERVDEYVCNSGLIDTNENAKPAWMQFKSNITQ